MTSFIFRSHIHGQARTKWAVVRLQSLIKSRDPVFQSKVFSFSSCLQTPCSSFSTPIPPSSSSSSSLTFFLFLSEPPEAYIDNEHDEKNTAGCQLGIGGAGVQILGVAPVLLWQAGQVAGLGVQRCRVKQPEGRETTARREEGRKKGQKRTKSLDPRSIILFEKDTLHWFDPERPERTYQREPLLSAAPPLCSPPWSSVRPGAPCWCCPDSSSLGCQCTTSWFFGCRCLGKKK